MKRAHGLGTIAAVLALACSTSGFSAPPATRTVDVIDPMFHQVAFKITIPAGWLIDATVLRNHFGPMLVFRTSAPDGWTGLQLLPRYNWVTTNDPSMHRFYEF